MTIGLRYNFCKISKIYILTVIEADYILYHGDCLEELNKISDQSVDLVLADLPYGTTSCAWDSIIPMDSLWNHYRRVIKPRGAIVLFSNQPFTSVLIASNLKMFKYNWLWEKPSPTGFLNANYRPLLCFEEISVFSFAHAGAGGKKDTAMIYNPQGVVPINKTKCNRPHSRGKHIHEGTKVGDDNILNTRTEYIQKFTGYPKNTLKFDRDIPQLHPTQKPVALLEFLILTYTNPGDLVLDNAMGSGSTCVAALRTERRFIGMEKFPIESKPIGRKNPNYFYIAQERITDTVRKLKSKTSLDDFPLFRSNLSTLPLILT